MRLWEAGSNVEWLTRPSFPFDPQIFIPWRYLLWTAAHNPIYNQQTDFKGLLQLIRLFVKT